MRVKVPTFSPLSPSYRNAPMRSLSTAMRRAKLTLPLLTAVASLAAGTAGCKKTQPRDSAETTPTPTVTALGSNAPSATAAATIENPYVSDQPNASHHVAMQLPQPVLEPTPAEDPAQYVEASPPWPSSLTPVYGSELVAKVKASGKRGVLINAWASWCGPCRVEMPMLLELRETYAERGIDVWFVSVNQSSEADQVLEVIKERKVPAPHYVAKGIIGYFIDALSPIWQGSLPSTFLYDGEGELRYFWGAHVFEEELTPVLDDFLAGKSIDGIANVQVRKGPPAP